MRSSQLENGEAGPSENEGLESHEPLKSLDAGLTQDIQDENENSEELSHYSFQSFRSSLSEYHDEFYSEDEINQSGHSPAETPTSLNADDEKQEQKQAITTPDMSLMSSQEMRASYMDFIERDLRKHLETKQHYQYYRERYHDHFRELNVFESIPQTFTITQNPDNKSTQFDWTMNNLVQPISCKISLDNHHLQFKSINWQSNEYKVIKTIAIRNETVTQLAYSEEIKTYRIIKFTADWDQKVNAFKKDAACQLLLDEVNTSQNDFALYSHELKHHNDLVKIGFYSMFYHPHTCTLADLKISQGPCKPWALFYQISLKIQEMHDKGILHGDIHAPNILLIEDKNSASGYQIKLIDFEFSYFITDAHATRTISKYPINSNHFPPERCDDIKSKPNFKSDVYMLAYMLKSFMLDLNLKMDKEAENIINQGLSYDCDARPSLTEMSEYLKKKMSCNELGENLPKTTVAPNQR